MEIDFKKLYDNLEDLDIVLIAGVDNERISAHRLVLKTSSDYFKNLLGPNFAEGRQSEILIQNIDGETLRNVVKFCYLHELKISDDNISCIADAASLFLLTKLQEKCWKYLLDNLSLLNCVQFYVLAYLHNYTIQKEIIFKFICNHFEYIETTAFDSLEYKIFEEIIKNKSIHAEEDLILKTVIRWIEIERANRSQNLEELMKAINLRRVTGSFLAESSTRFFFETNNQREILDNEILRRLESESTLGIHRFIPGKFIKVVTNDTDLLAYTFQFHTRTWELLKEFAIQHVYHSHLFNGKILYSFHKRGCTEFNLIDKDDEDNEIFEIPSFPDFRNSVSFNDYMFGLSSDKTIIRFETTTCYYMKNIHQATFAAPSRFCVANKILYVLHSRGFGCIDLTHHEIIDPSWNILSKPPIDWNNFNLVAVNDCLYAIDFNLQIGLKFSFPTNRWTGVHISGENIYSCQLTAVNVKEKTFIMSESNGKLFQVVQEKDDRHLVIKMIDSNESASSARYFIAYSEEK